MSKQIEIAINKAQDVLDKIKLEDGSSLRVDTGYGSPNTKADSIYYDYKEGEGYYIISTDRGKSEEHMIAKNLDEMIEYFVNHSIASYACEYECKHRRYFEDCRRQRDEIIEWCYKFIDGRKIQKHQYDDKISMISDLIFLASKECEELLQTEEAKAVEEVKNLCNYVVQDKFLNNNQRNINNSKEGLIKIHDIIEKLQGYFKNELKSTANLKKYYEEAIK